MNGPPTAQQTITNNTSGGSMLPPIGSQLPPIGIQPQRKTLQETIRDIEMQIGRFEQLRQTQLLAEREEQDLRKLRELLSKALAEQERVRSDKIRQQEVQQQLAKCQQLQQLQQQQLQQQQLQSTAAVTPDRTSRTTAMGDSRYNAESAQVLNKKKIQDLVKEIDPNTQLDEDVEEMLLQIADDFIENIVTAGCQLAKHRKSNTLEVKDVLLHLERNWNMWIPGYASEENRPQKRPAATEAHKQRMALIRKTLKK